MLGRWGDFDSDVLLNANLSQEDHAYLDAGGLDAMQPSRRRTADDSKQNPSATGGRVVRTAATSSTLAPPSLSRQTFHHVNAKSAMFSWMLESDSLRRTIFDALTPVWIAAKIAAGHTTIMSPHVFDLVAQRLAKRFARTVLPSHGVVKDRQMHADAFCLILARMIKPVITNTTIPECLFAVRSVVDAIVCHDVRGDGSVQFRPMEAIEPVQAATATLPPLSTSSVSAMYMEPTVNQSLALDLPTRTPSSSSSSMLIPAGSGAPEMAAEARLAQEDQLKQKLRLRKHWSSQASDTAARILPDEIPLFHREDMRSRAKSREQPHRHDDTNAMLVDTRPPTRTSDDLIPDNPSTRPPMTIRQRLHTARLQDPFAVSNNDDASPHHTIEDSAMTLVCAQCDVNEAALWCSQCYTITCVACWPASHSTPVPTSNQSTHPADPLGSCVHTQSVGSLQQGPPLPLLRIPSTHHTTGGNAMPRRRNGAKLTLAQPQRAVHTDASRASLHIANSFAPRAMSMPSLQASMPMEEAPAAVVLAPHIDTATSSTAVKPTKSSKMAPDTKRQRKVLRHSSVDINAMLPDKVNNNDHTIP